MAVRAPVAAGVNVTLTRQVELTVSEPPQVLAEMAKSAELVPVSVILESVTVAEPVFLTVVESADDVPPTV